MWYIFGIIIIGAIVIGVIENRKNPKVYLTKDELFILAYDLENPTFEYFSIMRSLPGEQKNLLERYENINAQTAYRYLCRARRKHKNAISGYTRKNPMPRTSELFDNDNQINKYVGLRISKQSLRALAVKNSTLIAFSILKECNIYFYQNISAKEALNLTANMKGFELYGTILGDECFGDIKAIDKELVEKLCSIS